MQWQYRYSPCLAYMQQWLRFTSPGLSLSFWNLFYKDSGHSVPSCVGVKASTGSCAIADPESHAHLSLPDVIAVALNMADAMRITGFVQTV